MANFERDESWILTKRLKDEMLRQAILASREKAGEPDESSIINYLIDKVLSEQGKHDFVDPAQSK